MIRLIFSINYRTTAKNKCVGLPSLPPDADNHSLVDFSKEVDDPNRRRKMTGTAGCPLLVMSCHCRKFQADGII